VLRASLADEADEHTDRTRKALAWHDLRATRIAWMAIRGDDPLHIQHRAGHTCFFATTQGYIRQAEAVRAWFGDVFPPLDALLVAAKTAEQSNELSKTRVPQSWRRGISSRESAERAGFEGAQAVRVDAASSENREVTEEGTPTMRADA
jgi:hypothetical protein